MITCLTPNFSQFRLIKGLLLLQKAMYTTNAVTFLKKIKYLLLARRENCTKLTDSAECKANQLSHKINNYKTLSQSSFAVTDRGN